MLTSSHGGVRMGRVRGLKGSDRKRKSGKAENRGLLGEIQKEERRLVSQDLIS